MRPKGLGVLVNKKPASFPFEILTPFSGLAINNDFSVIAAIVEKGSFSNLVERFASFE